MLVATGLVLGRTLLIAALAFRHHWTETSWGAADSFRPPLSVVIAAYNEEKVIRATVESVLQTDYAGEMEIVVVDDGSKDQTVAVVEKMTLGNSRIRLIRQENAGKAVALRTGLAAARHEIVVLLDADTHFQRDTLQHLAQPLQNPAVGAVSGRARVGNLRTWIARFQSLEYICGFNLDRQAYHEWNCITVVPGAISAFRQSAIARAGGIRTDTLAEDTDLTLSLHRQGYRIAYTAKAVAWTEAPETIGNLAKQRFRWAFGTLQCLWKHRDLVFNPEYRALGCFSLPSVWFFQIVLVALAPLVDAVLIISLLFGGGSALLIYGLIFLAMDLCLALLATWIEKEKTTTALLILPMRVIYRPLLSWVIWRAIFRAIKGALVGWGKLERTASVNVQMS
jgi:peptidoglycan-N-acetylglucosamine deacetylase